MSCIFCRIVAGDSPCSPVYDDQRVLGFMDINPATPGHLLVVPKQHATYLADLAPDDGAALFAAAQHLAQDCRDALGAEGVNLFLADGEVAGQEVFHTHLHVLPRRVGDGFGVRAEFDHPDRSVLDEQATRIRSRRAAGPGDARPPVES
jgi:diadenosine tetraphosphate (Ap4A) HIT family hydrolase